MINVYEALKLLGLSEGHLSLEDVKTAYRKAAFIPMAEKKTVREIKKIQRLRATLMGLKNINFLQGEV